MLIGFDRIKIPLNRNQQSELHVGKAFEAAFGLGEENW
jgi:hypothetical protein